MIVQKPHPMPCIQDILQSIGKFKFATSLDMSMGYWGMGLSEQSRKICIIVLQWGLYEYKYLPMGIALAVDFFQAQIMHLL